MNARTFEATETLKNGVTARVRSVRSTDPAGTHESRRTPARWAQGHGRDALGVSRTEGRGRGGPVTAVDPPLGRAAGEPRMRRRLLLLTGDLFAERRGFLGVGGTAGFGLLLRDFLLGGFRRSIAHGLVLVMWFDPPARVQFLGRQDHHAR